VRVLKTAPSPEAATDPRRAAEIAETVRAVTAADGKPGGMVLTGGETAYQVLRAGHARALDIQGELRPGIPISIIRGGLYDGVLVITKAGAFGASDALLAAVHALLT
jgi:uncharacterized protein YgbK (DUF1537 family)